MKSPEEVVRGIRNKWRRCPGSKEYMDWWTNTGSMMCELCWYVRENGRNNINSCRVCIIAEERVAEWVASNLPFDSLLRWDCPDAFYGMGKTGSYTEFRKLFGRMRRIVFRVRAHKLLK